jgi:hypothetical protein
LDRDLDPIRLECGNVVPAEFPEQAAVVPLSDVAERDCVGERRDGETGSTILGDDRHVEPAGLPDVVRPPLPRMRCATLTTATEVKS